MKLILQPGGSFRIPGRKGNVASDFDDQTLRNLANSFVLATGGGHGYFEEERAGEETASARAFRQISNANSKINSVYSSKLSGSVIRRLWACKSILGTNSTIK